MVAKISHGSNLYGTLAYNQEKVDEGLGKEFSANVFNEWFANESQPKEQRENLQMPSPKISDSMQQADESTTHKQPPLDHLAADDAMGSLFSVFTPEVEGSNNKQPTIKPKKKKKKRRYGRQW